MTASTIEVRAIDPDDEALLGAYVAIVNAVTPESPTSIDHVRWIERTYPSGAWLLAFVDGVPAGAGTTGRIYMHEASYERYWFAAQVPPEARRRGIGTAIWVAASRVARADGKTGLETGVSEAQVDGVAFLRHRGFVEVERAKMVRLDLDGLEAPPVQAPPGVVLTTLAERPDLAAGTYPVALEAYADIPVADEPVSVGTLEEFLARDVHRDSIPPGAFTIALDEGTGEVVGWASLSYLPGSTTLAWHDMTAVRRAWRGRGIATALKRATIAWAISNGLEALETGNDVDNAPMRAVNARLGYRPMPDEIAFRGPLAPA